MHAVSHSLAQQAHQAPPATCTWTCWQPYNAIQSLSACSSPAGYLHTPASSVTSASPTPPQALTICKNDCLQNAIITPPIVSQARELPICDVQKSRYVIGLVGESKTQTVALVLVACMIRVQFFRPNFLDQAVKSLCYIWHPQDILNEFMMLFHATMTGVPSSEHIPSLINNRH